MHSVCTKSLSESAFSPDLLDIGTILFSFDVQKDFAMIANEDAKDKFCCNQVCEKTGQLI